MMLQKNCEYDYVKVTSIGVDGKGEKVHGTYCGTIAPPYIVTSETNRLRVEFNSDTSVQKSGFAAVFFTGLEIHSSRPQTVRNLLVTFGISCP